MRAVFPKDAARRAFLKSVGASTALAALSQLFPLKTATEAFAQGGAIEKKDLKVGFIPITCATPIIMAHPMGFYSKHGLNVEVIKTAGWAVVRDKTINKEYDAAHMLSPMPLAITLGAGSNPIPYTMPAVENINGQAITLAIKHKDKRDPKSWKGFKFAVPFDYSMHNYLLRYYIAEYGIDPDQDIQIRAVPPPEMVANLRADNIDGFLAPDPVNQRAVYEGVGFIHVLSKDIWDRHPCCAFAASKEFVTGSPNTYAALLKAIIDATAFASKQENRKQIAEAIAPANYLNQPVTVVEQVLTGTFADGLGNVKRVPDRIDFDPFPWQSFAIWILTQMKRWGQIKGDVDYKAVAEQVYLATDTAKLMKEVGNRRRAIRRASPSWARSSIRRSRTITSRASPSSAFKEPFRRETDHGNDVARSAGFAVAVRLVRRRVAPRPHGERPRRQHGPGIRQAHGRNRDPGQVGDARAARRRGQAVGAHQASVL
jgi:nitrate/nitrite transport system substrate-binding protein